MGDVFRTLDEGAATPEDMTIIRKHKEGMIALFASTGKERSRCEALLENTISEYGSLECDKKCMAVLYDHVRTFRIRGTVHHWCVKYLGI